MMRLLAGAGAGGPTFDPTTVAGCVGWFDPTDAATITASGGAVSQWADKSGNSWHVTQPTAGNRPTTGADTINGLNAIKFVGSSAQSLFTPSAHQYAGSGVGNLTTFAVVKPAGVSGTQMIVDYDDEGAFSTRIAQAIRLEAAVPWGVRIASGVFVATGPSVSSGTAYVICTVQRSAAIEVYVDGVSGGAVAMTGPNAYNTNVASLGLHQAAGGSYAYTGALGDVVLYNADLGTTDRQTIEAGLKAKWGTA